MKQLIKNLLICCLMTVSLCTTAIGSEADEKGTHLTTRLATLENQLSTAEQAIADKINTRPAPQWLAQLPVSEKTLTAKRAAFNNVEAVTQSLVQADDLQTQLLELKKTLSADKKQLESLLTGAVTYRETLQSIQQLLENPVNQAELSAEQKNRLPTLVSRIEALQQQTAHWGATVADDEAALQRVEPLLATWVNAHHQWLGKQKQNTADNEKMRLATEKQHYEKQADTLQQKLDSEQGVLSTTQQLVLQQQIDQARTQAWLSDVDSRLLDVMKNGREIRQDLARSDSLSIVELAAAETRLDNLLAHLTTLRTEVEDHYTTFQKRTEITGTQADTDAQFTERMKLIAYQQLQFDSLPKQIGQLLGDKKQHNLLHKRPWLNATTWGKVKDGWAESLLQIAFQIKISAKAFYQAVMKTPLLSGLWAVGSLLLILISLRTMRLLEKNSVAEDSYDKGFVATLAKITTALGVLRYPLAVALFILVLVRFTDVPSPGDTIIRLVIYTLAGVSIAWVMLDKEQKARTLIPSLSRQGQGALLGLAAFVLLYGLSLLSGVDSEVTLFYEKALMLSGIIAVVVLSRIAQHYGSKMLSDSSNHYLKGLRKALVVLPWAVVVMCLLNIVGYGRLSWLLLGYLGVLSLFVLLLGLGFVVINQLRKRSKLWSIKHLTHGAFVAQDIVSPLSFMLKLTWLYGAAKLLFMLLGWDSNSYAIAKLLAFIQYPVMTFGETAVTLQAILFAVIALFLIFRIARWLKRFSYHWLFAKISDLGVRNSLSIFSQYLIVLTGVLMTLKLLGIDLTSLAVFAGALGVGIGLGLQDIAKNFISGILLLIERPLRSGDWVILDGSEGYVKSIGMRAITMETFDSQEVIIPNGNAINNSFTNYTHSSNLTRTIVYVGAGYSCEPKKVLAVLENVISDIKAILPDPSPRVILWEYGDSSINYRIQYHIDLDKSHLWDTKTEVLTAIWYAFQENDIEIPFPQRDINFRNGLPMTSVDTEE